MCFLSNEFLITAITYDADFIAYNVQAKLAFLGEEVQYVVTSYKQHFT